MKVRLEQDIDVNPLANVSTVTHITRNGIENICRLIGAALHGEPSVKVSHVVNTGHCGSNLLLDFVGAEIAVLIEKLRQIRTYPVTRSQTAKQSRGCHGPACFESLEVRSVY